MDVPPLFCIYKFLLYLSLVFIILSLLQNSPFVEKENKLPYCRKAQFSKNTLAGSSNIGINRF